VPNRKGYGKVGKRKAAFQLSHSHDYYEIPSVMGYGFKGQVQTASHPVGVISDIDRGVTLELTSLHGRQKRNRSAQ
jgi:hypothetical protein